LMRLAVPDLEADKAYKEAMVEQAERQVKLSLETLAVAQQEAEEAKAWELRYVADLKYQMGRYERFAGLVREGAQEKALAEEAKRQMESAQAARDAAAAVIRTKAAKARAAAEDLELARRKVDVARADVKKLDEMIKLGDIIAPFDGVIVRRL